MYYFNTSQSMNRVVKFALLYFTVMLFAAPVLGQQMYEMTFKSTDGVQITGNLMNPHPATAPFIILCHQAGWSRGEYSEIIPKLVKRGYNCLAIDQRSGGRVNGVENKTALDASRQMKQTRYVDAIPDIKAAINQVRKENLATGKLILWGSSYSAALTLVVGAEKQETLSGLLAFSPGEYFTSMGKSNTYIKEAAAQLSIPVFITSARNEEKNWKTIYEAIPAEGKQSFVPETLGNHGSRALWNEFSDSRFYWKAVDEFLASIGT